MDQLFAQVVDHIALAGPHGSSLLASLTAVLAHPPRTGTLVFLYRQFAARPQRFRVTPDASARADEVVIIAHDAIRLRALGFSSLEQSSLPTPALQILVRVGMARSDGILQSELGQYVGLAPNMVHHYLGGLIARSLVVRKKVVLTKRRPTSAVKEQPEQLTSQLDQLKPHQINSDKIVTYTAVVVLTRYAPVISQSSASRPVMSLTDSSNPQLAEDDYNPSKGPSVIDLTMETRVNRVMRALQPEPHTRSEKDVKVIAMPDSDRTPDITEEHFRRRRHRCYRVLRAKLERAGLVEVVHRECRARNGKSLGRQACMKLTELGLKKLTERKDSKLLAEDFSAAHRSASRDVHPLLSDGTRARFVEEVGVVEQIYQLLRRAGKEGISIPEMNEYLDGGSELTALPGKRIRRIVDSIAKMEPIVETQRFEGSAMYLRIALKSLASPGEVDDPKDSKSDGNLSKPHEKQLSGRSKRRKLGVTSLGQRRQEIVLQLLRERKAILLEPLGREVAVIEGSGLQRIDPKVLRRLLNDLLLQNVIKIITAMKPAIKESTRNQTVTIVASPEVQETSDEVRTLVSSVVNRALYGASEDAAAAAAEKTKRESKEQHTTRKRKRVRRSKDDETTHEGKKSKLVGNKDSLLGCGGSDETDSHIIVEDNHSSGEGMGEGSCRTKPTVHSKKQLPTDVRNNLSGNISDKERNSSVAANGPHSVETVAPAGERDKHNSLPTSTTEEVERSTSSTSKDQHGEINGDEIESSDDVVVADVVGKKITCINKLRAIDYGVLKGKMARVRSFHKTMYLILRRDQNSEVLDQPVGHHTVEATKQAEPLGRFTISDIVSNMTVSEYAASIGLYQDHGDKISSLNEEKISTVRHQLEDDVQGQTSARQILNLVQTLTRLGLVESGGNSQWALSGGGIIRDFGRGMPSGVMPHGIIFSSMEAVNTYWRELEQFARCRMSRKPLHVEPEGIEDETKPFGKEIDNEIRSVSDVYFPMRWATGVVRLQKRDQLIYESMLQLLSGLQLELNLPNTLITSSFVDRPLRRFSIEELEEGFEKYRDRIPGLRATQRSMPSHEKLLLYSRYRMKNPMPSWIRQREDNLRRRSSPPENSDKDLVGDHSCILHLSSREAVVEGCHFSAGIPTLGNRKTFSSMIKARDVIPDSVKASEKEPQQRVSSSEDKEKEKKEDKDPRSGTKDKPKEKAKDRAKLKAKDHGEVDVHRMVQVCKALVTSRATAYYCNNSQSLDWKAVTNWISWYARTQLEKEMGMDEAVLTVKTLVNAMVKLCEISMVRSALDALALKAVVTGLKSGEMYVIDSPGKSGKMESSQCMENVINSWKELIHILLALVALQKHDLKYSGQVTFSNESVDNLPTYESAQRLVFNEFELNGLVYGREELLSHMLEVMSFRYRRVADMHMRENLSHGMLVRCMSEAGASLSKRALCCTKRLPRPSPLGLQKQSNSKRSANQGDVDVETKNGKSDSIGDLVYIDEAEQVHESKRGIEDDVGNDNARNVNARQSSCGSGKYRRELVELVVQIVGREHSYRQDSEKSRQLLDNFCWGDIALARDRLLLRGALNYRDERDNGSGSFVAARKGSGNEYLSMLRNEDEVSTKWMTEIYNAENEVYWEKSKLREAVSDSGEASVSSVATNLLAKKMFFMNDGVCMMARMSNSGASQEAIQLCMKAVENDWNWGVKRRRRIGVRSELKSEVRRRLLCAIGESGCSGRLLTELLELVKPRSDEDRAAMIWGLQGLLRDGCIQRFVVEEGDVGDEHFAAWHGVLYVRRSHCGALVVQENVAPNSSKPLAWWRNTDGVADTELIGGVRNCVLNALTMTPGVNDADLTAAVTRRFSGAPRRAVLDVAWALRMGDEIRVECCVRDGDALTGRWRICSVGREMDFVDGLAVFAWRRGWRCAWSVTAAVRGSWEGARRVADLLDEQRVALVN